jgi:sporulation protein YlmC with PRC-barrel domain
MPHHIHSTFSTLVQEKFMHLSATTLRGNKVTNYDNEDLGTVEDFMLDTATGIVDYAVLSFGGIMGIGDKLFAVPMQALKVDTEAKKFVLNADRETLKNAPGFDKDHWPNTSDPQWHAGIDSYYSF